MPEPPLSITIATKLSNRVSSLQSIFPPRLFLRQTVNGSCPRQTHGLAQLTRPKIIKSLALAPAAPSPPIGSSNPTSLHQVSTLSAPSPTDTPASKAQAWPRPTSQAPSPS